jgi:hypothetical protein
VTAFTAATAALLRDPNIAVDALYRPGGIGLGVAIRVIRSAPDQVAAFGEGRFVTDTVLIAVCVAVASDLVLPSRVDLDAEGGIGPDTDRGPIRITRNGTPVIVGRWGKLQRPADRLDPV